MTSGLTEADKKRLRLQGITKAAREPFLRGGARKAIAGNFTRHVCHTCGLWCDCWLDPCPHVTCVLAQVPGCPEWRPETAGRMK